MSGSRSKKSDGKYDNPKAGEKKPKRNPDDVPLGTGGANQAKEDLKEIKKKRFPDPDDY